MVRHPARVTRPRRQQRVKRLFWAPLPTRDREGERGRSPCLQPLRGHLV